MATYFTLSSQENVNTIVIDDTFKNLEFRGKFQAITIGALPPIQGSRVYADVQFSGVDPLIAISSTIGFLILSRSQSGNNFTYRVLFNSTSSVSFTYFIFDEPTSVVGENFFSVRNAQNQIVFNAANKYMRILAALNSNGTSTSVSFQSGRTPAILMGLGGVLGENTVGPGPGVDSWLASDGLIGSFARLSGSTAYVDVSEFARNNSQGSYPDPPPYTEPGYWGSNLANHLVVDVTGY